MVFRRSLPLITNTATGRGEGVKLLVHSTFELHDKKGGGGQGVQIVCENVHVNNGKPKMVVT